MMIDGFILNYFWRERFSEILLLHQKIKYFHDKLFDTLTIFRLENFHQSIFCHTKATFFR